MADLNVFEQIGAVALVLMIVAAALVLAVYAIRLFDAWALVHEDERR